MLERRLFIWHDFRQVLQQVASSNHKSLVQLVGFQVKVLTIQAEPALDVVEVEEGLLGCLDDPLFLHL